MKAIVASTRELGTARRIGFPSMAHLFTGPTGPIDVHSALLPAHFADPNCKLVVGVVLHDGKNVFLVEPTRAPYGSKRFIFPQEKARYLKDSSFGAVALRGLREEIGLLPQNVALHPECLSWFENRIPLSRTDGVPTTKCIVYAVARIKRNATLRLNPNEVRQIVSVSDADSYFNLAEGVERARPPKWIGQTDALTKVVGKDILSGPKWDYLRQLGATPIVH